MEIRYYVYSDDEVEPVTIKMHREKSKDKLRRTTSEMSMNLKRK